MSSPSGPGPDPLDRVVGAVHADYHRETQQHSGPDDLVDDVVTYRMLAPHLMRTLLFFVVPTVLLLVKALIDYLASMSSPDDFTDVVSGLLGLVIGVLYVAGVAAFFAPAKEPIAEHSRLLEGRGDAAATAYDRVRQAAGTRQSPAEISPGTVGGVPVLLFRQHSERAMLLVQPYGRDLYVGWTMWRSRSTATLLLHFLRDTFGRFAPSPRFSAELRAASTRALRESVHSLAREGVAAAVRASAPAPPPTTGPPSGPMYSPRAAEQAASPPSGPIATPDPPQGPPASELPTAAPGADPHTEWTTPPERGERVGARRPGEDTGGWGPPPRDRW